MSGAMQATMQAMSQLHGGMMQMAQAIAAQRMMARMEELKANAEHGSAELLTLQQLMDAGLTWDRNYYPNDPAPGMPVLGSTGGETWWKGYTFWGKPKIISEIKGNFYLTYPQDRHVCTFGATGSGKSAGVIIPNAVLDPSPMLFSDPKGELVDKTAAYRANALGHKVHVLDPFGVSYVPAAERSHYNPLGLLRRSKHPDALALQFSYALAPREKNNSNPYFEDTARQLFQGLMVFVALDPRFDDDRRHFGTIRNILSASGADRLMYYRHMSQSPHYVVRLAGNAALDRMNGKDSRDDVNATAISKLSFFSSDAIIESMSRSDFDFATFRKGPLQTVYLCLKAGFREAFGGWQRLIMLSALAAIEDLGDAQPGDKVVRFLLDEFASVGPFPELLTYLPVARSYGIRFHFCLQQLQQLKDNYGDSASAFIGNSGAIQVLGGIDHDTAKLISEMLGKTTRTAGSQTRSTVYNIQSGPSASYTENLIQRDLLQPNEISNLPKGEEVLLFPGLGGAKARYFFWQDHMPWLADYYRRPFHTPLPDVERRVPKQAALPSPTPSFTPQVAARQVAVPVMAELPRRVIRTPCCRYSLRVPSDRGALNVKCEACGKKFHWRPS